MFYLLLQVIFSVKGYTHRMFYYILSLTPGYYFTPKSEDCLPLYPHASRTTVRVRRRVSVHSHILYIYICTLLTFMSSVHPYSSIILVYFILIYFISFHAPFQDLRLRLVAPSQAPSPIAAGNRLHTQHGTSSQSHHTRHTITHTLTHSQLSARLSPRAAHQQRLQLQIIAFI